MAGFIFGEGTSISNPQELARRRAIIDAMMAQGQRAPQNVGEGIYSAASSITDALVDKRLRGKEDAARQGAAGALPSIVAMLNGGQQASPFGGASAPSVSTQPLPRTPDSAGGIADDTMRALGREPMGPYRDAIASIESAGSGDYSAIGPTNPRLGRALGRYQIMEANIGPWSREILGREVTPDEFLANPQIQDAIFDGKFGGYVEQFGPEGAAQAWFAGPGGVGKTDRKDVLGTSVGDYTQKFSAALGGGGQPAQGGAPAGNTQQAFNPEIINQLAALSSNPYASEGQRQIAAMLMQQQMAQMIPPSEMERLELERARLENEQLRNPKPDLTTTQREYAAAQQQGFQGTFLDYQTALAEAKRTQNNVNVNTAGPQGPGADEEALRKKLGEGEGTQWAGYLEQGAASAAMSQDMEMLNEIIQLAPQGPLSGRLAGAFPGVNSAADAFNSIVMRLAPTMRAEGSGSTSDIEYNGMLKSLPQLANKPEANRAIAGMIQAKGRINQQRASIVSEYQAGRMSLTDARDAMTEINKQSIMSPELKALISGLDPAEGSDLSGMSDEEVLRGLSE